MKNRIILCIGTKKGLFVAESSKTRRSFALRGPFNLETRVERYRDAQKLE